jgi:hypothetical protein
MSHGTFQVRPRRSFYSMTLPPDTDIHRRVKPIHAVHTANGATQQPIADTTLQPLPEATLNSAEAATVTTRCLQLKERDMHHVGCGAF